MNSAEILVYGEVKDFAQTYDAFTILPTPLITVEEYHILSSPVGLGDWQDPLTLSAAINPSPATQDLAFEAVVVGQGPLLPTAQIVHFQTETGLAQAVATKGTPAKECDRALIISGGFDSNNNRAMFQCEVRKKYKKLVELGFNDDQIEVVYNDGSEIKIDGKNIVDKKASKQNIKEILEKFAKEMPPSCTLTIFVTDHGAGFNEKQVYQGARLALPDETGKSSDPGKTYPEKTVKIDLRPWISNYGNGVIENILARGFGGLAKGRRTVRHPTILFDNDKDGEADVRARWDEKAKTYVLERKMGEEWKEIGRDTNGDFVIDSADGGIDWNGDGDKNDQIGFHEGVYLWGNEVLWDDEFAKLLKPLHEDGIHILVEMSQCFGGGFIENLRGIVEKIVAFSAEDTKVYERLDATGASYCPAQDAFVENLAGIDLESWDKAFEKAKEEDERKWEQLPFESEEKKKFKNEYSK